MCGLTGFLDFKRSFGAEDMGHLVTRMRDALAHRGPDDAGNWVDPNAGIALGHRRLSIVDLSPLGHQPMTSADGRYVLAFNGEIYNFEALRHELEGLGSAFRSRSDTEVVLAAVVAWGLPRALERFNGMFAIALWDRTERALFLARDRFGEKPLFYGAPGGTLLFGSELKALREHPSFDNPVIDRASLAQFLRFLYVPTPGSIFVGVKKLPPASWLRIAAASDVDRAPTPYWSMREVASHGVAHRFEGSEADAVEALDQALRASVRMRMVADVPLGAFLSGGIDSSTIVALMQAQSSRPVRTFTIGFAEEAYNEAEHAKAVAKHLHTDHTELYVTPEQARAVIPRLPMLYDEPFADPSQVPTFLVSQLARQHVTVALSGDGGDELFGGYNRYYWADAIWRRLGRIPRWSRALVARAIMGAGPSAWARVLDDAPWLPALLRHRTPGDKLQKLAEVLDARSASDLYLRLVSTWKDPAKVVLGGAEPAWSADLEAAALGSFSERMMYADTVTYLPDDILAKVDRASMGVSLECRVPLLDPDVASLAWTLPRNLRVREDGKGKVLLRSVLERYVPTELFERPKAGFGLPIDTWLRGPLREWAESLLEPRRLRQEGFFEVAAIRTRWDEHRRGARNWQYYLWAVLMFQAWREAWAK